MDSEEQKAIEFGDRLKALLSNPDWICFLDLIVRFKGDLHGKILDSRTTSREYKIARAKLEAAEEILERMKAAIAEAKRLRNAADVREAFPNAKFR